MQPKIKYYIEDLPANIYFQSEKTKWYMYFFKLYLFIFRPKIRKDKKDIIPTTLKHIWGI